MQPSDIDYINAHGTSTPLGDELELGAVRRLFGNAIGNVSMSSTKSAIGHLLGGAGAVESIFCILAMRDQIVPPTLNLDNPEESCTGVDLDAAAEAHVRIDAPVGERLPRVDAARRVVVGVAGTELQTERLDRGQILSAPGRAARRTLPSLPISPSVLFEAKKAHRPVEHRLRVVQTRPDRRRTCPCDSSRPNAPRSSPPGRSTIPPCKFASAMFCFRLVMFFMRELIASIQSCEGWKVRNTGDPPYR